MRRLQLYPAVAQGLRIDVLATQGLIHAHLPVGRCACSGELYGVDLAGPRQRDKGGRWWLTMECDGCGALVAWPGHEAVDAGEDAPTVVDRSEPLRPVEAYRQLVLPVAA